MYFYFDKGKYYVSAKKYPYLSSEQIREHNNAVREVEELTKEAREQSKLDESNKAIVGLVVGSIPCVVIFIFLASGQMGFVGALFSIIFISIPILGVSYGVSQNLPANSDLKVLESDIESRTEYLNNELLNFEELKKKYAQYWLSMNGWQFEKEVAKLYEAHGYEAVVTKGSDDGGIDIFLTKDGVKLGVQCKNYHKPAAQVVIRELAGAMLHENLDGGIVIASSGYTKRAKEFAENKPIELLNINDVLRMHADTLAMNKEYFVPDCPKCGSKDVAEHIYGLVDGSYFEELESQGHKFIFEGCMTDDPYQGFEIAEGDGLEDDEENDYRNYSCNTCSNSYTWRDWRAKQVKT